MEVLDTADGVYVNIKHDAIADCEREIGRDEEGLYIRNDFILLNDKGTGLGSEIFGRQVEQAILLGAAYIECDAARSKLLNGYYTWPRFGYDAIIDVMYDEATSEEGEKRIQRLREEFPKADSILDVMSTKEGRDWWKENGFTIKRARFDLKKGSRSRQVLEAYMEERDRLKATIKKSLTNGTVSSGADGNKAEEIDLNAEEEAALERAWEKLSELWQSKESIVRPMNRLRAIASKSLQFIPTILNKMKSRFSSFKISGIVLE